MPANGSSHRLSLSRRLRQNKPATTCRDSRLATSFPRLRPRMAGQAELGVDSQACCIGPRIPRSRLWTLRRLDQHRPADLARSLTSATTTLERHGHCHQALADRRRADMRFKTMYGWKDRSVKKTHRGNVKRPLSQQAKARSRAARQVDNSLPRSARQIQNQPSARMS